MYLHRLGVVEKKDKWVPVDITITTKRPPKSSGGSKAAPAHAKPTTNSKAPREDGVKGKFITRPPPFFVSFISYFLIILQDLTAVAVLEDLETIAPEIVVRGLELAMVIRVVGVAVENVEVKAPSNRGTINSDSLCPLEASTFRLSATNWPLSHLLWAPCML